MTPGRDLPLSVPDPTDAGRRALHPEQLGLHRLYGTGPAESVALAGEGRGQPCAQPVPTKAFFPDWGLFMPFEMITSGATVVRTDFSVEDAVNALCAGQDVLLGTVEGKGSAQIPAWTIAVDWGEPVTRTYEQRDGTPVVVAVRWSAASPHRASCP